MAMQLHWADGERCWLLLIVLASCLLPGACPNNGKQPIHQSAPNEMQPPELPRSRADGASSVAFVHILTDLSSPMMWPACLVALHPAFVQSMLAAAERARVGVGVLFAARVLHQQPAPPLARALRHGLRRQGLLAERIREHVRASARPNAIGPRAGPQL